MVGGVLINGAVLALLVIARDQTWSSQAWLGAVGTFAFNPDNPLGFPVIPVGFNFVVSLLTGNVVMLAAHRHRLRDVGR